MSMLLAWNDPVYLHPLFAVAHRQLHVLFNTLTTSIALLQKTTNS